MLIKNSSILFINVSKFVIQKKYLTKGSEVYTNKKKSKNMEEIWLFEPKYSIAVRARH